MMIFFLSYKCQYPSAQGAPQNEGDGQEDEEDSGIGHPMLRGLTGRRH